MLDARLLGAVRAAGMAAAAVLFVVVASTPARAIIVWSLDEQQPNIPHGGRVNALAVNPADDDVIIASTESGGLFRTSNRGANWTHIGNFKPVFAGAVAYMPGAPAIVLATARDLFAASNQGGIWRSADGGVTWTRASEPTPPPGVSWRYAAGEISIAPDTRRIYVATSWGVAISDDEGLTWSLKTPFSGLPATSVAAQIGGRVIAGNWPLGVSRSIDHGGTWSAPAGSAGGIADMHAFGRSPAAADTFYAVNGATALYVSEDSGASWTPIASAPTGGGGCGGIAFIKAVYSTAGPVSTLNASGLRLYFGNRCWLYRQIPTEIAPGRYDYSGPWVAVALDHADTRDLAFTNGSVVDPMLLGTDGGIHKTFDRGQTWSFAGGGAGGFNALQITEVKGQWINDIGRYDLYFGTQDNNNWASSDLGGSWPGVVCCEGFFFEMQKRAATAADAQVTFTSCGACVNLISGGIFSPLNNWTNPPGTVAGNPTTITNTFHVQGVNAEAGFAKGMAYTRTLGAAWAQYATFPEDRRDIPKLTRRTLLEPSGRPRPYPVQYQPIRTGFDASRGFEINTLARLSKSFFGDTAFVSYPAMSGFGGLGINPTMFAWYQVLGVDPTDWRRLIAPDVVNEKMMGSADGGETWTEIPGLTSLVTDSGRFNFRSGIFPFASAVSVHEGDPNMIAVGTHQNGLILSADRGATWLKVPFSERASYITSIEWKSSLDAFVSTYGRGLWRLKGTPWIPRLDHLRLCIRLGCIIRYIDRGDPPPFRDPRGILVFDGRILDVRFAQGRLSEVIVTPGASIGYLGKEGDAPKVKATETAKLRGAAGKFAKALKFASGQQLVGVVVGDKGELTGHILASGSLRASDMAEEDEKTRADAPAMLEKEAAARSPIADKPYFSLTPRGGGAGDVIDQDEAIVLQGSGFAPGTDLEIVLDDEVVGKARVGKDGAFRVELKGPREIGFHTLVLRDAATKKVIDGVNFIVRHVDKREEDGRAIDGKRQ